MVDAKVIEAVSFFKAALEKKGIRINDLVLFGSSATGTLKPGSDIDIAIISEDFSGMDIFNRALATKDAELSTIRKFRIALDIITLAPEEFNDRDSLFFNNIRKGLPVRTTPAA
jgi:predicted nucleotidyltransferase